MAPARGKYYAIVPAAGRSTRMGQSKLLLPFGQATLMDLVLRAWTESHVDYVFVTLRTDDHALRQVCSRWDVEVVNPAGDPRDMKESVQCGIRHIGVSQQPVDTDRIVIAPADLPTLSTSLINRLIDEQATRDQIVVPQFGEKTGHPVLIPWCMTTEIFDLAVDEGINRVVERHDLVRVMFPAVEAVQDIDTPADYQDALRTASRKGSN